MTEATHHQVFDQFVGDIETSLQLVQELEQMLKDMHSSPKATDTPYFELHTGTSLGYA